MFSMSAEDKYKVRRLQTAVKSSFDCSFETQQISSVIAELIGALDGDCSLEGFDFKTIRIFVNELSTER